MIIIAEIMLFGLVIFGILVYVAFSLLIAFLDWVGDLGQWLYEAAKPKVQEMWDEWQRERSEARKPGDIKAAGAAARDRVDEILSDYSQDVDQIFTAQPNDQSRSQYSDKVIYLDQ